MSWLELFPALQQCEDPGEWLELLLAEQTLEKLRRHYPVAPAPTAFSWQTLGPSIRPLPLSASEKKAVQAFGYMITHRKKSSKRLQIIQALYERFKSEDLAEMILSYQLQWLDAEQAQALGQHFLQKHPTSLGLRLPLALLAMGQKQPEQIETVLAGALNWPEFVAQHPELPASPQNIRTYHIMTCLYFLSQPNLVAAIWAWTICREAGASQAERQTLSRQIVQQAVSLDDLLQVARWLQA